MENENRELTASERYYQNHLDRMRRYVENNREAIYEKNRQYFKKVKEDPEKYERYLERKRESYKNKDPEKKEMYLQKKREQYQKKKLEQQDKN